MGLWHMTSLKVLGSIICCGLYPDPGGVLVSWLQQKGRLSYLFLQGSHGQGERIHCKKLPTEVLEAGSGTTSFASLPVGKTGMPVLNYTPSARHPTSGQSPFSTRLGFRTTRPTLLQQDTLGTGRSKSTWDCTMKKSAPKARRTCSDPAALC